MTIFPIWSAFLIGDTNLADLPTLKKLLRKGGMGAGWMDGGYYKIVYTYLL